MQRQKKKDWNEGFLKVFDEHSHQQR